MKNPVRGPIWGVLVAAIALTGCGGFGGGGGAGGSTVPPSQTRTPTQIAIASGENQQALKGTDLPDPLVVVVTDAQGSPVAGVSVSFAVGSGGGALGAATATTDALGQAKTTLTVGPSAGPDTVLASAANASGQALQGSPLTFHATATDTPPPPPPPPPALTYVKDVAPILNAKCTLCHAPGMSSASEPLDTFAAVTQGTSKLGYSPAAYVVPNQPAQSLLLIKVMAPTAAQGSKMPVGGSLSATEVQTISDWIAQGAVYQAAGGATQLQKTSGDGQSATAGGMLAAPFVVTVLDASNQPVQGVPVAWSITAGNGALSAASATTDAAGQAKTTLTTGLSAGTNSVAANVNGIPSVSFAATGLPGPASKLVLASGDNQVGIVSMALANPLVVAVTDMAGNGVAGKSVAFAVTAGGGSLSAATATTNAQGLAPVTLTLGAAAGTNTVTASVSGLSGSPVTFHATANPKTAASLAKVSGDNQTGVAGTALPKKLVVVVKDSSGAAVGGVSVGFAVSAGGGSLSAPTATSGTNGQASVTLTLGATAGTNKVVASVSGLAGSPLTFTETGTAATTNYDYTNDIQPLFAAHCTVCHGPGGVQQNAPLDTFAHVTGGTTKYGYTPTKYVVAGDPSKSLIDAKLHGTAGGANMATQGGLTAAQVAVVRAWIQQGAKLTNAGAPASLAIASGDAQTGPTGTVLPAKLTVLVKDAAGNVVPGTPVAFAVIAGGGSLSAASATTGSNGEAGVSLTLGAKGANSVKATVGTLTPVTFNETATASVYSGAPLAGSTNPLDIEALKVLKAANVEPAALSSDEEFLRRVTADIAGRLPTASEMKAFVADTNPNKRAATIDVLLASADYADHWARDIFVNWVCLRESADAVTQFGDNVKAELMKDTSVAELVTTLVEGGGAKTTVKDDNGNIMTWGEIWLDAHKTYGGTAQVDQLLYTFAGQTAQCGRCHDHKLTVKGQDDPLWKQDDTYGLYAYVANTAANATKMDTSGKRFGQPVDCHFVADGYKNEVDSMVTVGGSKVAMTVANTPLATRRAALAKIFTASDAFSRGTAHRIFAELVDPLLDPNQFLAANLAAVKQKGLLATLASEFEKGKYSLKSFIRLVCNSKLYQLTTAGTTTKNDDILARRTVRRHHGEVIEHGLYEVTGNAFTGPSSGFQAQFGYPLRHEEILDRTDAVNIGQAFMLLNSPAATNGLAAKSSSSIRSLANQVSSKTLTLHDAVDAIFKDALGRSPTAAELAAIDTATAGQKPLDALEDVVVAVCASSEFVSR